MWCRFPRVSGIGTLPSLSVDRGVFPVPGSLEGIEVVLFLPGRDFPPPFFFGHIGFVFRVPRPVFIAYFAFPFWSDRR